MATTAQFGDLRFPVISPDELALLVRASILHGLKEEAEGPSIRTLAQQVLPLFHDPQLSVVLTAFERRPVAPAWQALAREVQQRLLGDELPVAL